MYHHHVRSTIKNSLFKISDIDIDLNKHKTKVAYN